MGLIASRVEAIKPVYDAILKLAREVDTRRLQNNMEAFVMECFLFLKPLSHEYKEVCDYDDDDKLCIGAWIRRKYRNSWYQLGSFIDTHESFFYTIRKYGNALKPHVRRPIKDVFAELVDLTKRLVPYADVHVELQVEMDVYDCYCYSDRLEIQPLRLKAIYVETDNPSWVRLYYDDGGKTEYMSKEITQEKNLCVFEDIINHVLELYRMADERVNVVRQHNEAIMARMSEIVAPWKIANSLKPKA